MISYSYRAFTAGGTEAQGMVQAMDEYNAVLQIRDQYPVIKSLKPIHNSRMQKLLTMELGSKKIKSKSLAMMCSQFAITLKSGMPIVRAMDMIARQTEDKRLKKILTAVSEDVAAGNMVASCFEKYKESFPPTFIETVRAGEQSGTLDRSFEKLQSYYEKSYKTTEKIRSAMTYPIFVVCVAIVVLIVVMAKVIPTLAATFSDLGGDLPLITKVMIDCSTFFAHWWMVMIIFLLAMIVGWKCISRTEKGERFAAKLAISLPVIGRINCLNGAAQFANTMSVMLASGLTLDRAAATTAKTIDNYLLRKDVFDMIGRIEEGRSLGRCIRDTKHFPANLKEMCSVGEETGELDQTLNVVGNYFTNEADHATKQAIAKLEPALLVMLAIFAGFIVFAIYLPIFTMYDLM